LTALYVKVHAVPTAISHIPSGDTRLASRVPIVNPTTASKPIMYGSGLRTSAKRACQGPKLICGKTHTKAAYTAAITTALIIFKLIFTLNITRRKCMHKYQSYLRVMVVAWRVEF